MMSKNEITQYQRFFHDVSAITRAYIIENAENTKNKDRGSYPQMRPGFRGYLVRELIKLRYCKVQIILGDLALRE